MVLTKFPVALSGGNKENRAPVAGDRGVERGQQFTRRRVGAGRHESRAGTAGVH